MIFILFFTASHLVFFCCSCPEQTFVGLPRSCSLSCPVQENHHFLQYSTFYYNYMFIRLFVRLFVCVFCYLHMLQQQGLCTGWVSRRTATDWSPNQCQHNPPPSSLIFHNCSCQPTELLGSLSNLHIQDFCTAVLQSGCLEDKNYNQVKNSEVFRANTVIQNNFFFNLLCLSS